jgi:transcriptional regulator with XRE-family HTH domain
VSEDPTARHLYSERVRIGRNIRSLRDWRDQRQEPLAEVADFSDRTLRRVESGDTNVGINTYILTARALRVPLSWLFDEKWPEYAADGESQDGGGCPPGVPGG